MLELTTNAAKCMRAALTECAGSDACFRIAVTEGGVQLAIDQEREGDATVKDEDEVLVVLDAVSANVLEDRKIDYDEESSRFVFV